MNQPKPAFYKCFFVSLLCLFSTIEMVTAQNKIVVLDTLKTGNYVLTFLSTESFLPTEMFADQQARYAITDSVEDSQRKFEILQPYLAIKFAEYFYTTDSSLMLKLKSGKTIAFPKWDDEMEEGYTYENYFENIGYSLLRVQKRMGNIWMLVNQQNGNREYIQGLPYISMAYRKIIVLNADIESRNSFNGIELLLIQDGRLQKEFSKETEFGPTYGKWLNENQFLLKCERLRVDTETGDQDSYFDFKKLILEKKTGH